MDTRTVYDAWSEVYDTDGNFLQALDTIEMRGLVPRMLSLIEAEKPWRMVDLGCGTGRNTMALVSLPDAEVAALDLSPKMQQIAKERASQEAQKLGKPLKVTFEIFDMISAKDVPECAKDADAIVSTLVIEHIPLSVFFRMVGKMLKLGGLLLLTNMHSDMGNISQAGFYDPTTGEKVRPVSYSHTVEDCEREARKYGLAVVGQINERSVDAELALTLGKRANKWIGVTVWFGGIFRKIA